MSKIKEALKTFGMLLTVFLFILLMLVSIAADLGFRWVF